MEVLSQELQKGYFLKGKKYQIVDKLGSGGFGITYKAFYEKQVFIEEAYGKVATNVQIPVAVKELFISGRCIRHHDGATLSIQGMAPTSFKQFKERFLKEASLLSQFREVPEIVQVIDFFEENNTAYMVMTFVEGSDLASLVKDTGPLSEGVAMQYLMQVANGLAKVHEKGILHRDISPDNIIITPKSQAVLIDFGAARAYSIDEALTQSIILKHGYAPIEQYSQKRKRGPYTDLYALGATAWFCVSGQKPEPVMERSAGDESFVLESASADFNNWSNIALAYDGKDRFQNCQEAIDYWYASNTNTEHSTEPAEIDPTDTLILSHDQLNRPVEEEANPNPTDYHTHVESEEASYKTGSEQSESTIVVDGADSKGAAVVSSRKKKPLNRRIVVASTILLLLLVSWCGGRKYRVQQLLSQGWEDYVAYNLDEAEQHYTAAASYGSGKALYFLGKIYQEKDVMKSDSLFNEAYNADYGLAAYYLGQALINQDIASEDTASAAAYFSEALANAKVSTPEAQNILGNLYERGFGVQQNGEKAYHAYQEAADEQHPEALVSLGRLHRDGIGVEQDFEKAISWFERASHQGIPQGITALGDMYYYGNGIKQNYAKAVEYYEHASALQFTPAEYRLGMVYELGKGKDQSYDKALKWYKKAAEQGSIDAQMKLASAYEQGHLGLEQDTQSAKNWYQQAASPLNVGAYERLVDLYEQGEGAEDQKAAVEWCRKAAEQGSSKGATKLARYYHNEVGGLNSNDGEALQWYRIAAEQEQLFAQLRLARGYELGNAPYKQSDEKAAEWYLRAAKRGDEDAMKKISKWYRIGKGLSKDLYEADRWALNAAQGARYFTLDCQMQGEAGTRPFEVVVLERPAQGMEPLEEEADRLRRVHNAKLPDDTKQLFNRRYTEAKQNGLKFTDLLDRYGESKKDQRLIMRQVSYFETRLSLRGYRRDGRVKESYLYDDEFDNYSIRLRKGYYYKIFAFCDEKCGDIDLILKDENDNIIDEDKTDDDYPLVEVTPKWSGSFELTTHMYECGYSPCRFGVVVFKKRL
jgi:TPR repeat protein/serine/threonine protein kinase